MPLCYDTREAVASLSDLDPDMKDFFETNPCPSHRDVSMPTVDAIRRKIIENESRVAETYPTHGVEETVVSITMRDGYQSEIRVHRLPNADLETSPLVVLLYGGGWVSGTNRQFTPLARAIARLYGATVVNLSYRMAPDNTFPTAPNDVWDSVKWLAAHGQTLGANPHVGFVIGGGSAGGNLAAVTAQKAVREPLAVPLTGVWACIPALLTHEIVPEKYKSLYFSREQNAIAPVLDAEATDLFFNTYAPDIRSPDFSPFNDPESFSRMPPAYVQVAGRDPLRDDGLIYERTLRDHGVLTRLDVYPGMPHGHFAAYPDLPISIKALADAVLGVGWLLGKDGSETEALELIAPPASV